MLTDTNSNRANALRNGDSPFRGKQHKTTNKEKKRQKRKKKAIGEEREADI